MQHLSKCNYKYPSNQHLRNWGFFSYRCPHTLGAERSHVRSDRPGEDVGSGGLESPTGQWPGLILGNSLGRSPCLTPQEAAHQGETAATLTTAPASRASTKGLKDKDPIQSEWNTSPQPPPLVVWAPIIQPQEQRRLRPNLPGCGCIPPFPLITPLLLTASA